VFVFEDVESTFGVYWENLLRIAMCTCACCKIVYGIESKLDTHTNPANKHICSSLRVHVACVCVTWSAKHVDFHKYDHLTRELLVCM
jgi:hypothetical protein